MTIPQPPRFAPSLSEGWAALLDHLPPPAEPRALTPFQQMMEKIDAGDTEGVRDLLARFEKTNQALPLEDQEIPVLEQAVEAGQWAIALLLVNAGQRVSSGYPVLEKAASAGRVDLIDALDAKGQSPDSLAMSWWNPHRWMGSKRAVVEHWTRTRSTRMGLPGPTSSTRIQALMGIQRGWLFYVGAFDDIAPDLVSRVRAECASGADLPVFASTLDAQWGYLAANGDIPALGRLVRAGLVPFPATQRRFDGDAPPCLLAIAISAKQEETICWLARNLELVEDLRAHWDEESILVFRALWQLSAEARAFLLDLPLDWTARDMSGKTVAHTLFEATSWGGPFGLDPEGNLEDEEEVRERFGKTTAFLQQLARVTDSSILHQPVVDSPLPDQSGTVGHLPHEKWLPRNAPLRQTALDEFCAIMDKARLEENLPAVGTIGHPPARKPVRL